MLFNSFEFLVFFPCVVALYFAVPHRWRWSLLLAASYYFYAAWKAEYLVLIVASTLVDYGCGLAMGARDTRAARRPYLALSLISNLGLLFAFKYFNFFNDSARRLFDRFDLFYDVPAFDALLPVGISFYTFQTLAYSIDVYRGRQAPERHLGIFALYVSFFPQLVAGPIERSGHLLPQFRERRTFDYGLAASGVRLMGWGFFKKVVIADRLALYVNAVYADPAGHSGWPVILATYFFAFQIYCDFSGYSDIAIGAARVMGYDLMENFRRPYFAKSIAEFWRRWHISLSTWFRDYLYIPLGGNRVARARWYLNLFVVFVVSGLWHGAAWTFVIWGALHGLYLIAGVLTAPARERTWGWLSARWAGGDAPVRAAGLSLPLRLRPSVTGLRRWWSVFATFHLVLFAWVFFRAGSVRDALTVLHGAFDFAAGAPVADVALGAYELTLAFAALAVLLGVQLAGRRRAPGELLARQPVWIRWPVYYAFGLALLVFGEFGSQAFIYFQF